MAGIIDTEVSVRDVPSSGAPSHQKLVGSVYAVLRSGWEGVRHRSIVVVAHWPPAGPANRISRKRERWVPCWWDACTLPECFLPMRRTRPSCSIALPCSWSPLWLIMRKPPQRSDQSSSSHSWERWASGCRSTSIALWRLHQESTGFSRVLQQAEPEKRMAGMMVCNSSDGFANPVYLHFAAWYQAQSRGISDRSFAITHPNSDSLPGHEGRRGSGERIAWHPLAFHGTAWRGELRLLHCLRPRRRVRADLQGSRGIGVQLVAHERRHGGSIEKDH